MVGRRFFHVEFTQHFSISCQELRLEDITFTPAQLREAECFLSEKPHLNGKTMELHLSENERENHGKPWYTFTQFPTHP